MGTLSGRFISTAAKAKWLEETGRLMSGKRAQCVCSVRAEFCDEFDSALFFPMLESQRCWPSISQLIVQIVLGWPK